MNFEIILNGKPNAGCHKATCGLDEGFCQNLVDKLFKSMNSIKDTETLIVDVRNWKGIWYSVYTLWLGGNILDTSDRGSFLAISIVVPKEYYCLVSAVYDLLVKAYKNSIIGAYISNKGKYIVSDFGDDSTFENLVAYINLNFINLSEKFDDSFKQATEIVSIKYYSLLDCDSKAFVEDLKNSGRIFVSNAYESKDSRLLNTDKIHRELQSAKLELEAKRSEITDLTKKVGDLEVQLNNSNSKANKTLDSLQQQLDDLRKEKDSLNEKILELSQKNEKYKEKEDKIVQILGANNSINSSPKHPKKPDSYQNFKFIHLLPIVNTILLLLLFITVGLKSCESQERAGSHQTLDNEELIEKLEDIIEEFRTLKSPADGFGSYSEDISPEGGLDFDCGLQLFQDNKPVSSTDIDVKKPLTIIVNKEISGYTFHTSNLNATVESGKPFELKRKNSQAPIIITYRSNDLSKLNKVNKIEIP